MFEFMRHLFRRPRAGSAERDPSDDFWYQSAPTVTAAGVPVSPAVALQVAVVYDCLQVLSQPLASLPFKIFRRRPDGGKEEVEHPVADLLRTRPNPEQTGYEFRGMMQWNLALYNNAYAEIRGGARYGVGELWPLHPSLVTPRRRDNGEIWYEIHDGGLRRLREDQIWHLKGLPLAADGLLGTPPWECCPGAIATSVAAQDYAARFFANSGISGGVIEAGEKTQFKDDLQKERFMAAWRKARTGKHAHRDGLLEFGMKYHPHMINNEQAQFTESRKELALEITRIWHIPPHKVGILDNAHHNNIEHQALEFVSETLLPWLVLWEQAIARDLIVDSEGDFIPEFNVAGILRGDLKSRYDAYAIGRQWGWLSVNEVRALENLNPIEGGEAYMVPLNMSPADRRAPTEAPKKGNGDARAYPSLPGLP